MRIKYVFILGIFALSLTFSSISYASAYVACLLQAKVTEILLPSLVPHELDWSFKKLSWDFYSFLIPLSVVIQTSSEMGGGSAGCPSLNEKKTILVTVPCEEYLAQLRSGSVLQIRYSYLAGSPSLTSRGVFTKVSVFWEVLNVIR